MTLLHFVGGGGKNFVDTVPDCKCRFQTFLQHLHVNFRHHTARINQQRAPMDVQSVSLSKISFFLLNKVHRQARHIIMLVHNITICSFYVYDNHSGR